MFDAYAYFKAHAAGLEVYRVTGLARMEELVRDSRNVKFPCIVVDYGVDGMLDLNDRSLNRSYHTVHFLDTSDANPDMIFPILSDTFERGRALMRQMAADRLSVSRDPGPCAGFDVSTIRYSAIGPLGMQAYGHTFNYEIVDECCL